ncbi:HDOD domain-containing protein [Paludibacterium paludis]|uniref:HDOD domain-containing protein n=1 Tax=Paludibacterium paludis TaxID=1225769 RepID=A0A918P3I5_9NEIS|nr:HDOD domain-containing protein [Paludibacterium paludis]GGY18254.1 HDOD domain-containing protein [Paludibacterium paludis]
MASLITDENRDQLLKNLVIPPRPDVLDQLTALRNDPDINLVKVARVIGDDVALSAAMMKAANTPVFSRGRKVTSVSQAISLLGVKNVVSLIGGIVLRTRLTGDAPACLEGFWEQAMMVAMISSALCDHIAHVPEDARSFALFHNCGVALMLMRYPGYERTLAMIEHAPDERISQIEHELHETSHDVVGFLVARAWNMPEAFCQAILLQYDPKVYQPAQSLPISHEGRMMIAIVRAATHVWRTRSPDRQDPGWSHRQQAVLAYLGLDATEYEDWRDAMHQRLLDES